MSKISAEIVADSINTVGCRLTTMKVTYPRIVHSEIMTHRMFSRNSASSRAIPFNKMLESVQTNPFVPIAWQKDHKGMQGTEYFNSDDASSNKDGWLRARDYAVCQAKYLSEIGLTKQLCNRLLEPFMWHTVLITASDWENFFTLRCPQYEIEGYRSGTFRSKKGVLKAWSGKGDFPSDLNNKEWFNINKGQSEIHMMALAEAMYDAINESTPKQLQSGEWHIPFGDDITLPPTIPIEEGLSLEEGVAIRKVQIATARCARISYTVVGEEGKAVNHDKDFDLHDRLLDSGHLSPFEHCAQATEDCNYYFNFKGFKQYRYQIQNSF